MKVRVCKLLFSHALQPRHNSKPKLSNSINSHCFMFDIISAAVGPTRSGPESQKSVVGQRHLVLSPYTSDARVTVPGDPFIPISVCCVSERGLRVLRHLGRSSGAEPVSAVRGAAVGCSWAASCRPSLGSALQVLETARRTLIDLRGEFARSNNSLDQKSNELLLVAVASCYLFSANFLWMSQLMVPTHVAKKYVRVLNP